MKQRAQQCRERFAEHNIDALLVTDPVNRRYLTGFTGTAGVAVITENEAYLVTDFRYKDQAEEQADSCTVVIHKGTMHDALKEIVQKARIRRLGIEEDHVSVKQYEQFGRVFGGTDLVRVSGLVEQLRMVKDEQELRTMKEAARIADETFDHIVRFIQPGMREREVALELEFHMRKLGAASSSFDMIVASGYRSALPHGVASGKRISNGELLTLDFGALYDGYCSDITRTLAVGEVPEEMLRIYDICLQAQQLGVAQIRAGMTGKEADAVCRRYIEDHGYGDAFGHSTGHGLGLQIHEKPTLSVRSEVLLAPGMVVTVEPGIYLSGKGGVRIEDDIVITADGNERLTHSSKELQVI